MRSPLSMMDVSKFDLILLIVLTTAGCQTLLIGACLVNCELVDINVIKLPVLTRRPGGGDTRFQRITSESKAKMAIKLMVPCG
jgi:hypothetical protein